MNSEDFPFEIYEKYDYFVWWRVRMKYLKIYEKLKNVKNLKILVIFGFSWWLYGFT